MRIISIIIVAFFASLSVSCGRDVLPISDNLPEVLPDSTVFLSEAFVIGNLNIENEYVTSYLRDVDYSGDIDYKYSFIEEYLSSPIIDLSIPKPVVLWNTDGVRSDYDVLLSRDSTFSDNLLRYHYTEKDTLEVYNLIPGERYFVKIFEGNENGYSLVFSSSFVPNGTLRSLKIEGDNEGNFRDLGGWTVSNGKRIRYDILFRGPELYRNDGYCKLFVSDEGIRTIIDNLCWEVEVDFGDFSNFSPLKDWGIEVIASNDLYGFGPYDRENDGLASTLGRKRLSNTLTVVFKKVSEGKKVFFHCNSGADRTAVIAFIIEGLLGVSDSDKSKDYELTSFWARYIASSSFEYAIRRRNEAYLKDCGYNSMINYIYNHYEGASLNEKILDLCTKPLSGGGLGLSLQAIELFRQNMIEDIDEND